MSEVQYILVMTDALPSFVRLDYIARCSLSLIPNRRLLGFELTKVMMLNENAQCDLWVYDEVGLAALGQCRMKL